ncbi:anhydro-N-acetylmuramic acid kinase [Salinimonas chungwhensis]|uniref:anhydro-N-acetylmuramic acid kinase n=1 Tax=Salinimonas chungwhensis TaxID=265425 RepID=UPI00037CC467|nr:anhydro-N-acetylmuramic acid kinase [Salinimonas chungwhensis]
MSLYIGLMSGTSMDGVDAVLCRIHDQRAETLGQVHLPYPPALLDSLHKLCLPGHNELVTAGEADIQIARLYSQAVLALLRQNNLNADAISAIGSHGQTVRHHPDNLYPFTIQLGDPNTLTALTGIPVVADFRRKDMALGGQGAPLVPAFHQAQFATEQRTIVVNIGGIANLSVVKRGDVPLGFDTGPGNTLMDHWINHHLQQSYDTNGDWAASGTVSQPLLNSMLSDKYFAQRAPKSTGREYFNSAWLQSQLAEVTDPLTPADVQATLCALTANTICQAIHQFKDVAHVYICGGGAFNQQLVSNLQAGLGPVPLSSTAGLGIHPQWVEGAAFAWLAFANLNRLSANVPAVTGASRGALLGGLYLPD